MGFRISFFISLSFHYLNPQKKRNGHQGGKEKEGTQKAGSFLEAGFSTLQQQDKQQQQQQ